MLHPPMTGAIKAKKGDHQMLPQTSSIVAQKQERGPIACISRWAARSAKLAGAAAVITLLASPQTFANAAEGSSRIAQEGHACSVVLGLDPSDRRYDTCIRSLDRTLAEWDQAQVVQTDRRACSDKGLAPGTSAFAVCVVNAEQSPTNTGRYGSTVPAR
jgi:hypothetical protein